MSTLRGNALRGLLVRKKLRLSIAKAAGTRFAYYFVLKKGLRFSRIVEHNLPGPARKQQRQQSSTWPQRERFDRRGPARDLLRSSRKAQFLQNDRADPADTSLIYRELAED